MKSLKILVILILIFSTTLYSQDSDVSSIYEQVIKYYNLARDEYKKGEYIKSYEYSQIANDLIQELDAGIFFKTIDLILVPLNAEISKGLENIKSNSDHTNVLIQDDYNKALNMYSNATAYHNEAKGYDAANIDMAKSVFNVAKNNYESTIIMIDYMEGKLEYYAINIEGINDTEDKDDAEDAVPEKEISESDEDLIAKANTMFVYIARNNIITMNSYIYTSIKTDINAINNYKRNNDNEMANEIASESIEEMSLIILRHDNIKLIRYANNGMKKATRINRNINENEDYQNITTMVEDAKALYNDKNYEKSLNLLSKSIMSLQEDFNIFKNLPKTYTVVRRRNAIKTDSFWNIAGYDFIYANNQLWDTLYKENRNKLRYKNNPRIISVGSVFTIPSIIGEKREGRYNPNNMYIPITVYYYLDYENGKGDTNKDDNTTTETIIIETIVIETNDDDIKSTESGIRVESIGGDELGESDTSDQYETENKDTLEDNAVTETDDENDIIIEVYTEKDNN